MTEALKFPLPIGKLSEYLPHRPPAVWIDEVISVDKTGGRCLTEIKDAPYVNEGLLRPSSFIELIAQTYGFVHICQIILGLGEGLERPTKTYLVGIRGMQMNSDSQVSIGESIGIVVKNVGQLGPLVLVDGKVFNSEEKCLASGQIKIFAQ